MSQAELLQAELEDDAQSKFLTFTIGDVSYGLDIRDVTEIVGLQAITVMPDVPEHIKGVINLRGKVIPVMDVRARFKLPAIEYHERTCIIVVDVHAVPLGLVVDSVSEVIDIPPDQIEPPPRASQGSGRFVAGMGKVGDTVQILLDAERLLNEGDVEAVIGGAQAMQGDTA